MLTTQYTIEGVLPVALTAIDEDKNVKVIVEKEGPQWKLSVFDNRFATEKTYDNSGIALNAFSRIVSTLNTIAIQEKAVKAAEDVLLEKKAMFDRDSAELEQFLKGE